MLDQSYIPIVLGPLETSWEPQQQVRIHKFLPSVLLSTSVPTVHSFDSCSYC